MEAKENQESSGQRGWLSIKLSKCHLNHTLLGHFSMALGSNHNTGCPDHDKTQCSSKIPSQNSSQQCDLPEDIYNIQLTSQIIFPSELNLLEAHTRSPHPPTLPTKKNIQIICLFPWEERLTPRSPATYLCVLWGSYLLT